MTIKYGSIDRSAHHKQSNNWRLVRESSFVDAVDRLIDSGCRNSLMPLIDEDVMARYGPRSLPASVASGWHPSKVMRRTVFQLSQISWRTVRRSTCDRLLTASVCHLKAGLERAATTLCSGIFVTVARKTNSWQKLTLLKSRFGTVDMIERFRCELRHRNHRPGEKIGVQTKCQAT